MKKARAASLAALCLAPPVMADDGLQVNGYFSTAYAKSDSEALYRDFINDEGTFRADSIAGLQVVTPINDRTSVTLQALARPRATGDDVRLNWAYASFALNEELTFRVGRIASPLFLISDYATVAYSYPWVRPPVEMYNLIDDFGHMDGGDFLYRTRVAGVDLLAQPFFGSFNAEVDSGAQIDVRKTFGLAVAATVRDFTLRLQHSRAEISVGQNLVVSQGAGMPVVQQTLVVADEAPISYSNIGLMYDRGLFLMAEASRIEVDDDDAPNVLPIGSTETEIESAYATLGYRFGAFLPHITYAETETPTPSAISTGNAQRSTSFGLRYDFAPSTALKLEYARITPRHGTAGFFASVPSEEDVKLYSVGVAVAF